MKKIYTLLALALMGFMPWMMTSCETEDEEIVYNLEGIWRGQIQSTYYYNRYGSTTEWTDTQIEFFRDSYGYARGRGREIDFNSRGYGDEVYFTYTVRNREISLDYEDGSHIIIYNWEMYNNTFRGEFHDYRTGDYLASFALYRVNSGWSDSFYGYDWYDDWYASQHKTLFPDED